MEKPQVFDEISWLKYAAEVGDSRTRNKYGNVPIYCNYTEQWRVEFWVESELELEENNFEIFKTIEWNVFDYDDTNKCPFIEKIYVKGHNLVACGSFSFGSYPDICSTSASVPVMKEIEIKEEYPDKEEATKYIIAKAESILRNDNKALYYFGKPENKESDLKWLSTYGFEAQGTFEVKGRGLSVVYAKKLLPPGDD